MMAGAGITEAGGSLCPTLVATRSDEPSFRGWGRRAKLAQPFCKARCFRGVSQDRRPRGLARSFASPPTIQ
jgi:hypothetical protein